MARPYEALAADLARAFGFPEDALEDLTSRLHQAFMLLDIAPELKCEARPSITKREREARRRLRADPEDDDAWVELFNIEKARRRVRFDSTTRTLSAEEGPGHKAARGHARAQLGLNAAVRVLASLWERWHHAPIARHYIATQEPGAKVKEAYSAGLEFLARALEPLDVHRTHLTPQALRFRLARVFKNAPKG